jgi:hypothetical protein
MVCPRQSWFVQVSHGLYKHTFYTVVLRFQVYAKTNQSTILDHYKMVNIKSQVYEQSN